MLILKTEWSERWFVTCVFPFSQESHAVDKIVCASKFQHTFIKSASHKDIVIHFFANKGWTAPISVFPKSPNLTEFFLDFLIIRVNFSTKLHVLNWILMSAEHQGFFILHRFLHGCCHFVWLTFEKSSTAADKNCITCKDTLTHILCLLVLSINYFIVTVCCDLTQVENMPSGVARCMETCNLNVTKLNDLLILDSDGAGRNIVVSTSNNFKIG